MARSYHVWTIGCQMNEADSRRLAQQIEFLGYAHTADPEQADLVILNTCVVKQQAEDRVYGRIGTLGAVKARRPGMVIGLMGCMVGMKEAPELRARFPYVDVFLSPSDTAPLLDFLQAGEMFEDPPAAPGAALRASLPLPHTTRGTAVTANVPVVLGCSHACTFCVIPYRRGAERSRPMADILAEVRALAEQGVREVTLLGQIIDRYGVDFRDGTNLSGLLREVAKIDELLRIRFLTSHPNYMTDEMLETVAATDKICPHIEVAVQAGNNEVLERMRRGYTHEQFRDLVARIRRIIPGVAIHTDVIVGFPGETDEQFMDTHRLLADLRLDKVHLSRYSERPKTIAARNYRDDISEDEKQRRWQMIEDLQKGILEEKNRSFFGKTVQVLVEELQRGRWRGRTERNNLVLFEDVNDRRGQLVDVLVDWTGPFLLTGKPVEVACTYHR
ncbi:MAG: tRNA (N6-isopentenyl adenosine(37)-C2)-methylthiotransferase MiaB [bacterium]